MERGWPDEAVDFEAAVRGSLERAGGVIWRGDAKRSRRCG